MPRDGLSQYAPPPGTNGITNYTIESTKYNGFVADVTQDLNLPRPIVAGGTGATNATDAMTSLQGDKAYQVVTNYDSYPFISGSFYSAAGATSAPTANAFIGHCYTSDPAVVPPAVPASANMFVEARDATTGLKYLRQKTAGVWGAWALQAPSSTALDAAYVNVSGDVMTGALTAPQFYGSRSDGSYQLVLDSIAPAATPHKWGIGVNSSGQLAIDDVTLGLNRFFVGPGGNTNVTANLVVNGTSVTVGSTGVTGTYYFGNSGTKQLNYDGVNYNLVGGNLYVNSNEIHAGAAGTTGAYFFGNAGKSLAYDGTNFNLTGGGLIVNSDVLAARTATTGWYLFGTSGTKYLTYDSANFTLNGGSLLVSGIIQANGSQVNLGSAANYILSDGTNIFIRPTPSGQVTVSNSTNGAVAQFECGGIKAVGHTCRQGVAGAYSGNVFNIYHTATQNVWIDGTNMGAIAYQSDYRIKKDVIDLPGMWDTVKALRPIKYTQAQFSPPSHIKHLANEASKAREEAEANPDAKPREVSTAPLFEADDVERWGFIAHELQATLTPSAANGEKDSPDTIQSPNPFTVIAALTKALQEAMTRIEALEAR